MKKIKSGRLQRTAYTVQRAKKAFYNSYGFVRVFRPVRRVTEENCDDFMEFTLKDMERERDSLKKVTLDTSALFWELKIQPLDDDDEPSGDAFITTIALTTGEHHNLREMFFNKFIDRAIQYKSRAYLRKSWAYYTTVTKTIRTAKFINRALTNKQRTQIEKAKATREKNRRRKKRITLKAKKRVSKARKNPATKKRTRVIKKTHRRSKKRKVRRLRHRGK